MVQILLVAGQKQCKPSAESSLYAEVQPVFANFICKDSDNYGIIVKFAPRISIVYQVTPQN